MVDRVNNIFNGLHVSRATETGWGYVFLSFGIGLICYSLDLINNPREELYLSINEVRRSIKDGQKYYEK